MFQVCKSSVDIYAMNKFVSSFKWQHGYAKILDEGSEATTVNSTF